MGAGVVVGGIVAAGVVWTEAVEVARQNVEDVDSSMVVDGNDEVVSMDAALELLLDVVGAGVLELLLDVVGAGALELLLDVVGAGVLELHFRHHSEKVFIGNEVFQNSTSPTMLPCQLSPVPPTHSKQIREWNR